MNKISANRNKCVTEHDLKSISTRDIIDVFSLENIYPIICFDKFTSSCQTVGGHFASQLPLD